MSTIITYKIRLKYLHLVLAVYIIFQSYGCAVSQKEIRAFMSDKTGKPGWQMVEKCGYQGCNPVVDFLTSKDMTIRIECDNDWKTKKYFIIRTFFDSISKQVEYNPSTVTVKFKNGTVLKPKAFTCSFTEWDLNYLRSQPSLQEQVSVSKDSCYLLFFDHPALAKGEEIEMNMNNALSSNGKSLDIPLVYFKKVFEED